MSVPTLLAPDRLADAEATYRDLVMSSFALEFRIGHHLAFLRTFASPTVAELLAHTGHIQAQPHRRATDTGLFMYELIHHGLDSPTGQRIVARLNQMHHHWKISNEDYLWVLATFAVPGIQITDRYGWRGLTDDERQATVDWYAELGTRMGVQDIPRTYPAFAAAFTAYENTHLARTQAGDQLLTATLDVALSKVPRALRPLALAGAGVIVDDPARTALALPAPNRLTATAVRFAFAARAARRRRRSNPPSWFVPAEAHTDYPHGYTIDDLGPATPRAADRSARTTSPAGGSLAPGEPDQIAAQSEANPTAPAQSTGAATPPAP